jgi:hypothetical protein
MRFEEDVRGQQLQPGTKYARLIAIPLWHYAAILKALPKITGANAQEYRKRLDDADKLVRNLASELSQGRSFLSTPRARELQRLLVPVVFRDFLSIRITPQQAISFAVYAESSEVVRDFLDFCRYNHQLESKAELLRALPVFEELVRPYIWPHPASKQHGPAPGELRRKMLSAGVRNRLFDQWFHPRQAMVGVYWSSIEAKEILRRSGLWPSACECFAQRFAACAESPPETLFGVLAFEMHQRACLDLARTAIRFWPPSSGVPNASPPVIDWLDQVLAELEESMRQANGLKSKKPLAPQLLRVR